MAASVLAQRTLPNTLPVWPMSLIFPCPQMQVGGRFSDLPNTGVRDGLFVCHVLCSTANTSHA